MARIRTIKPDFFTSENIVALSPMARLLYIAVWCEADREGRLQWKPNTLKIRYFPADNCDILKLCGELVAQGLVILYGAGLAHIPTFAHHQHINPRETASTLPAPGRVPDASSRVPDASSRVPDASSRDSDAQVGKEGKEGEEDASTLSPPTPNPSRSPDSKPAVRGSRLPADWTLPNELRQYCVETRPDLNPDAVSDRFRDYWHSKAGKDAVKVDWFATWRNWVREERTSSANASGRQANSSGPNSDPFKGAI